MKEKVLELKIEEKLCYKMTTKKHLSDIDLYLIEKAWAIRRTGEFIDWEVAKEIIRGK